MILTAFGGHREDTLPSWEGGGGEGGGGLAWETWKQSATVAQSKTSVLRGWAGRMGKWDERRQIVGR